MTNIALNARFYAHKTTGMQRYGLELARRFASSVEVLRPSRPLRGATGHLWEQLYLPCAVGRRLLWSPNNTGPLAIARQVCTIHDLIPLDHPEWFSRRFTAWYEWLLPRLARRVQHIIAISEFTKRRVVELLQVEPEKVTVIPNGVDERFSPRPEEEIAALREALGIDGPAYLLCVGSVEPRKNLGRLLAAWAIVQNSLANDVQLVIAGAKGSSRVFKAVRIEAMPPRVHFTGYVSDEQLPALYSGALALVYPSLYEGFGLPPLEAMACGAAVVTSNNTSIPEVTADAAVLVDPQDEESIAEGILAVVNDGALRDKLRRRGLERARNVTWEATARQTLSLLKNHA